MKFTIMGFLKAFLLGVSAVIYLTEKFMTKSTKSYFFVDIVL